MPSLGQDGTGEPAPGPVLMGLTVWGLIFVNILALKIVPREALTGFPGRALTTVLRKLQACYLLFTVSLKRTLWLEKKIAVYKEERVYS